MLMAYISPNRNLPWTCAIWRWRMPDLPPLQWLPGPNSLNFQTHQWLTPPCTDRQWAHFTTLQWLGLTFSSPSIMPANFRKILPLSTGVWLSGSFDPLKPLLAMGLPLNQSPHFPSSHTLMQIGLAARMTDARLRGFAYFSVIILYHRRQRNNPLSLDPAPKLNTGLWRSQLLKSHGFYKLFRRSICALQRCLPFDVIT